MSDARHNPGAASPTASRIVIGSARPEDEEVSAALRPRCLREFLGQETIRANLDIALEAARARAETLEHVLLSGSPGLGKTTLAHIIAEEMGSRITVASGPGIERAGDLVGILTNLDNGDVFFVDEIHRLPATVEEKLYSAMEDFRIDIVLDKGPHARTITMPLRRFTLVGATTRTGLLTAPLRTRFGIPLHLDFYTVDELCRIVSRAAELLSVPLTAEGAVEIARRSRGTPRIANRLLRRVRDYAQVRAEGEIDLATADHALRMQGVDAEGLDELDRRFLRTIVDYYRGGPVGIEALSATLNEETDTLVDVVEPYLLKIGFVLRTPAGRRASAAAYRHLNLTPPPQQDQPALFAADEDDVDSL
jgi:Holliday junction DNA helicase RuvB